MKNESEKDDNLKFFHFYRFIFLQLMKGQ